jgi:BRCA1-associated protein
MELGHHGPSSNDIDKISSIESITLEYSYLLSSQLESMRQHYEKESDLLRSRLTDLERSTTLTADRVKQMEESEKSREKAERKAERAIDLSRSLQATLEAEKAMSKGLSERIKNLERKNQLVESEKKEKEDEVQNLEETVRDLMFSLEAGIKVQEAGGESGEGGDLVVVPSNSKEKEKTKKKGKK